MLDPVQMNVFLIACWVVGQVSAILIARNYIKESDNLPAWKKVALYALTPLWPLLPLIVKVGGTVVFIQATASMIIHDSHAKKRKRFAAIGSR